MTALTFRDARAAILDEVEPACRPIPIETVSLLEAHLRILAEDVRADRDYPPFDRSARDGFALRAADVPGRLRLIGESRAGAGFEREVGPGEAVEIMTGAPVPAGADSVVMVEYCERFADGTVDVPKPTEAGENISMRGSEAVQGSIVLERGARIEYSAIALLATTGQTRIPVYIRPTVAILATGDEIVELGTEPGEHQIRNSNAWSLAFQVERAGGLPIVLPIARDELDHTRTLIQRGLAEADLLLLSGGVSAGKYDIVEVALEELGAEFFFDRVLIQPGQPLVFGKVQRKFFFGLPGNPLSTMVTFEMFARLAIEILAGSTRREILTTEARLTEPFRQKPGLTRFLPALVDDGKVTPLPWQGSADIAALCRANAFLVTEPERHAYSAGESIPVLIK